jgi:1,2-diacylglycerol 3-beta-galactosyltransferase
MKKKRILFLSSDTGGGHRAAAKAIGEAITTLYPNRFEIFIEDMLQQHALWPYTKIPQSYAWSINSALFLWKLFWSVTFYGPVYKFLVFISTFFVARSFQRCFKAVNPDLVICVHPILNHAGLNLLRKSNINCPFVTVITDMTTFHPIWIYPQVTHCFVSTNIAQDQAVTCGMPPHKVDVYGQPVSQKFITVSQDKQAVRRLLGLDLARPVVLITGGGEGDSRIFEIAQTLDKNVPQAQTLVVTGRNHNLKTRLETSTWKHNPCIFGFVDNMPELMQAADILVTKAGPGTISEAFATGLPTILFGYIPGQEEGNITYVQNHGAGVYVEDPVEITRLVRQWTTSQSDTLQKMSQNAAQLARPRAAFNIAEHIYTLLENEQSETSATLSRQIHTLPLYEVNPT